jgi:hypothetical protein
MSLGQRIRAVRALERGLALYPGQPELVAAREALGRRHRPALPFLSRRNWMNSFSTTATSRRALNAVAVFMRARRSIAHRASEI